MASAHDCSEGGLAVALAECCIAGGLGATVALDDGLPGAASLFSESQSRILVSLSEANVEKLIDRLIAANLPYSIIGEVGGRRLEVEAKLSLSLDEIAEPYNNSLEQAVAGGS